MFLSLRSSASVYSASVYSVSVLGFALAAGLALSSALVAGTAAAQSAAAASPTAIPTITPTPLPQQGLISSNSGGGYNGQSFDGIWGGMKTDATTVNPIGGSVFRSSPREWTVKVFNNGDEGYTADFEVIQSGKDGKNLRSDYFSASLAPKQSMERTYSAALNANSAALRVRSWKKR